MSLSSLFHRMYSTRLRWAPPGICAGALAGAVIAGCASPDPAPGDPDDSPIAARAASAPSSNAALLSGSTAMQAVAAGNAATLVTSRPDFLHASASEAFVQGAVTSSSGSFYVPYERTYAGLPVIGGDFVMVLDGAGQAVYHSVALERPVGVLSTTPRLTRAAAEAIAVAQLRKVTQVEGTQLVVHALGATARLAWESTVDGLSLIHI